MRKAGYLELALIAAAAIGSGCTFHRTVYSSTGPAPAPDMYGKARYQASSYDAEYDTTRGRGKAVRGTGKPARPGAEPAVEPPRRTKKSSPPRRTEPEAEPPRRKKPRAPTRNPDPPKRETKGDELKKPAERRRAPQAGPKPIDPGKSKPRRETPVKKKPVREPNASTEPARRKPAQKQPTRRKPAKPEAAAPLRLNPDTAAKRKRPAAAKRNPQSTADVPLPGEALSLLEVPEDEQIEILNQFVG